MGTNSDSPFAELLENSEHGDGNHKTLHPKDKDSFRNDKEKEIKINSLKADETYKYEYEVRVKSNNNEITNKVQAKCEDVKIESTEIKNKIEDAMVEESIQGQN